MDLKKSFKQKRNVFKDFTGLERRVCYINKKFKLYKHVFSLYRLSGVIGLLKKTNYASNKLQYYASNTSLIVLNFAIIVSTLVTNISQCINSTEYFLRTRVIFLLMQIVFILHRLYLYWCINDQELICEKLCQMLCALKVRFVKPRWLMFWAVLALLSNFVLFLTAIRATNDDKVISMLLFGYENNSTIFRYTFAFLYPLNSYMFINLPVVVFAIYYVVVCYYVKTIIYGYAELLKSSSDLSFEELSDIYCALKRLVRHIDSKVGFAIFISFMFNAFLMYLGIALILHPKKDENADNNLSMILLCLTTFMNFSAKTLAAAFVNDASVYVKALSREVKEDNPTFSSGYARFLHNCEEEICLTVWGVINTKRSLIFATFGTILTYSILFDSVKPENNQSG